ncbi:MAG: histone deacetylase family protein [Robiginitomaculum sp.]|nr:histone deacetylase family protein [Robiginitomaculum sp.]
MKTTLYTHEAGLKHHIPLEHAEQPDRLRAVLDALNGPQFDALIRKAAPRAVREDLLRVHTSDYVDLILSTEVKGDETLALDWDTYLSAGSAEAALRGAGAAVQALDDVMAGDTQAAFCATRPPGHHARASAAMGFCIFSNVAIAAKRALEVHGLAKVAVVDFDVHHGNGTQEALWDVPGALFISLHQQDHYPGTGFAAQTGGSDNVLNLPMPAGTSAQKWMALFDQKVVSRLNQFAPELILVSAGFDAHRDDPLGGLQLEAEHFAELAVCLGKLSQTHSNSRLVSVLEGGYDLPALGRSAAQFVEGLLEL